MEWMVRGLDVEGKRGLYDPGMREMHVRAHDEGRYGTTSLIVRCERSEPRKTHQLQSLPCDASVSALLKGVGRMSQFEMTVYMLRCADGSYYVGSTKQEVEARVWEHNNLSVDGYTSSRRPVTLVFTESYDRITDAIARERQIKGWSRRKKDALIALAYDRLPGISRRRHLVPKS